MYILSLFVNLLCEAFRTLSDILILQRNFKKLQTISVQNLSRLFSIFFNLREGMRHVRKLRNQNRSNLAGFRVGIVILYHLHKILIVHLCGNHLDFNIL